MTSRTKYVVCIADGCADDPVPELGGRTPLDAAPMPTLARLAAHGTIGRARTIPDGLPKCSSVGNMAIFGYDPLLFYTGRAPVEAAALGVDLPAGQVAFRVNLVTMSPDGTMLDFTGGRPSQAEAADIIHALNASTGGEVAFHAGQTYRHIMTCPADWADAVCVPPHDLLGQPAAGPAGPSADKLGEVMRASRAVLAEAPIAATQIWLWSQGRPPRLPAFAARHGVAGALVAAVNVVRGLGTLTGLTVIDVPGATGWYDTDYAAKRDAALAALADGTDLVIVHVAATDEAGHAGDAAEKVRSLASWDGLLLRGLVEGLDQMGRWRLLFLPDHATPVSLRTHTDVPVPYLLSGSGREFTGGRYSEAAAAGLPVEPAHELMGRLVSPG
jgi:2,3-bisphosphoglycerate-independent phosphoglycerate mutase